MEAQSGRSPETCLDKQALDAPGITPMKPGTMVQIAAIARVASSPSAMTARARTEAAVVPDRGHGTRGSEGGAKIDADKLYPSMEAPRDGTGPDPTRTPTARAPAFRSPEGQPLPVTMPGGSGIAGIGDIDDFAGRGRQRGRVLIGRMDGKQCRICCASKRRCRAAVHHVGYPPSARRPRS